MLTRIETVLFKREENSEWEAGIQLNYGELGILDKDGKFVEDIWDARDCRDLVIDNLDIILNRELLNRVREEEFNKQEQLEKEVKKHGITEDIDIKEYSGKHGVTEDLGVNIKEVSIENTYRNIGYTL